MLKFANQVIDIYDDVFKEGIAKLAAINPKINVLSAEKHAALKDKDFALCVLTKKANKLGKFPVNSHDDTWLSNQYFDMNWDKLPKVAAEIAASNIKTACARYGIKPLASVVKVAKDHNTNVYAEQEMTLSRPETKVANLEKFANAQAIGDDYTTAQYTMATPELVKVAARYFNETHTKMPVETRHKYAAAIQRRASELGMQPQGGMVSKYASDSYSAHVDAHIRSRMSLLDTQPELAGTLQKIASMKKEVTPGEFARAIYAFDKKAHLDRHYGGYLTDPFVATFASQPDQYAGYRYKTASSNMGADEIKIAVHKHEVKLADYFGRDMVTELKKDPVAIFDSMPNDAKEVFAGIASGAL